MGELFALDYDDLDLADFGTLKSKLNELKPDLIVNALAHTAVDRAESEPELATKVNGEAPGVMTESARRSGATLVHFSTDYVFDGTKRSAYEEPDPANPINICGLPHSGPIAICRHSFVQPWSAVIQRSIALSLQ